MTVDEIRDLIDNTITTNGVKNITGQALNLALNEIVNAVAEAATTGGGGVKRLYADMNGGSITDPEQLASNAALYTEIVTALTNNELPPQAGILISEGEGVYTNGTCNIIQYANSAITFMLYMGSNPTVMALTSDGNVSMGG